MEKSVNTFKQVQSVLKFSYGIIPIVAGADKFTNLLTEWENYLTPMFAAVLPFSTHTFMMIVGVIEIIAGILVFIDPVKGAYLVCAWLVLIALSLLAGGNYLDIAIRDLAMAIGAWSLAKLSGVVKTSIQG